MIELSFMDKAAHDFVAHFISGKLKKKTGYDPDIRIHEIKFAEIDGKKNVHIDLDAALTKEEFWALLKQIIPV